MTLEQLSHLRAERSRLLAELDKVNQAIDRLTNTLLWEQEGTLAKPLMPSLELSNYLQQLHLDLGAPSCRAIARQLVAVSHSTVTGAITGKRIPGWEKTRMIGEYLGADMEVLQRLWAQGMTESRRRSR